MNDRPDLPADRRTPVGDGGISDEIRAYLDGNQAVLADIVAWLTPLMESWAALHLGPMRGPDTPTGEDVVQDVWLRILPVLPTLEPHPTAAAPHTAALVGLVRRTLVHRIVDLRRAESRRRLRLAPLAVDAAPEPASPDSGPLTKVLGDERRRLIADVLDRLDERERAIYLTRVFELASVSELAERFEVTPAAVSKIRQRVRQRLEGLLRPQFLDDLERG